jgi:hypothetical protein
LERITRIEQIPVEQAREELASTGTIERDQWEKMFEDVAMGRGLGGYRITCTDRQDGIRVINVGYAMLRRHFPHLREKVRLARNNNVVYILPKTNN